VFDRVTDPIERIFGILDGYRRGLLMTNHQQGCPIGNLALELSTSHPTARGLIAANFTGWRKAIEQCLFEASDRLPAPIDRAQLALFVLTTMEGAVMLARTYQTIHPYDAAVSSLRDYFDRLLRDGTELSMPRRAPPSAPPAASAAEQKPRGRPRKSKDGGIA
jgi:hypothetical protein